MKITTYLLRLSIELRLNMHLIMLNLQESAVILRSAKEQCRIDNPLEIACNAQWIVRLPLAQFENMAIIRRLISPSLLTKVFVKNAAVGLLLS